MVRLSPAARTRPAGVERKSARELALMRAAGRINAQALAEMAAVARPGVTTSQLDALAERVILKHGAAPAFKGYPGPYPYPNATTISVNEALVHGIPGPRVLREGDLASLDCGTLYQGFYADSAITVAVGSISPLAQELLDVTQQALTIGIAEMRAGARLHQPWHRAPHARRPGTALLRAARHRHHPAARHDHRPGAHGHGRHVRDAHPGRPVDGGLGRWLAGGPF
jgi:Xaa-Pro aminopeptidase